MTAPPATADILEWHWPSALPPHLHRVTSPSLHPLGPRSLVEHVYPIKSHADRACHVSCSWVANSPRPKWQAYPRASGPSIGSANCSRRNVPIVPVCHSPPRERERWNWIARRSRPRTCQTFRALAVNFQEVVHSVLVGNAD